MDSARLSVETIATRGGRLVLWRVRIEVAGGDVGESLIEHLNLFETNEEGDRLAWASRFEATDVGAAYAELDARYEVGEGATPSRVASAGPTCSPAAGRERAGGRGGAADAGAVLRGQEGQDGRRVRGVPCRGGEKTGPFWRRERVQ
jgi:hypothetical protein